MSKQKSSIAIEIRESSAPRTFVSIDYVGLLQFEISGQRDHVSLAFWYPRVYYYYIK